MGGSDIRGTTPGVLSAFESTDLTVDVIIGPGFDEENEREIERVSQESEADLRLLRDPPDLVDRMFQADLAVSATGTTSYELLALGTPTIGIPQADNQKPIAEALSDRGAMVHLPSTQIGKLREMIDSLRTKEQRQSLRETGRELIDGNGTERIYQTLLENCG
jgi:spore coat polysaccharide biosynthesis predicted glycosyltransferase SpsG